MNLLHIALVLILSITGGKEFSELRPGIYDVVQACQEGPFINNDLESTVRIMTVMAYRESACRADVEGDSGRSIGVLQINRRWAADPEDLKDRKKAIRIGLKLLNTLIAKCGSTRAGIGAYMSGICDGAPTKTRDRCLTAGIGSDCKG
jgi:hypothetical protein